MTERKPNIMRILSLLLVCLLLTGCAPKQDGAAQPGIVPTASADERIGPTKKTTGIGFYFDTVVTLTLWGAPETLAGEVWEACARYEQLLSKTIATSDVSRINNAQGQTVTVDPETWEILRRAKEISSQTGGAFSITIAPVTALWTFTGMETNTVPTDEMRLATLPLVDDQKIILGENNTVTLPAGMQIDLGGIAKGYIADKVAALLREKAYAGIVYTGDCTVVTSGTYERGFSFGGVRYHHILDPKTGWPSQSDLVSATFVMDSSMTADALATACIVIGSEKSLELAASLGLDAMFITKDGNVLFTQGFEDKYEYAPQ